jgi:hypothetical protein
MKKTMLISVSYFVEIDNEEQEEKITNNLSNNQYIEIDNKQINLKWNQTSSRLLNPDYMNCGKCENCGCWTTDREKDDPIFGLDDGATHNGKLLCDECLPPDHRWAF